MTDTFDRLRAALAGRYDLERELGRGGMATVYLAGDLRHERRVAIKSLLPDVASALGTERFLREIKVAARLQHPHILPLYDSGEAAGLLFYVMPYVEGETLQDRMARDGPLPVAEAVRIARDVAEALEYAHQQGVVHRDIKPENIMLRGTHAVVADFGIAAAIGEARGARLTEAGQAVGTPAYMSPEQASGEEVDGRSDLYSLACVLFEMITGEAPFMGANPQAVLVQRLLEPPPRLVSPREKAPEALNAVLRRALARAPGERYPTGAALADALAAAVPLTTTTTTVAVLRRFGRLRAAGVVLLVLALGVLVVARRAGRSTAAAPPGGPRIVVLPFQNLGTAEDQYLADGITDEITARLASVRGLEVISHTSALHYRHGAQPLRTIGAELRVQYALEGAIRWERGAAGQNRVRVTPQLIRVADDAHLWGEVFDTVMTGVFDVQAEIAGEVVRALGVALLEPERRSLAARPVAGVEAWDFYLRGNQYMNRSVTETDTRAALEMYQRALALAPAFAQAWGRLAVAHAQLWWFDFDPSAARLDSARHAAQEAERLAPDLPETQLALGYYQYWGRRDYARALEHFARAERAQPHSSEIAQALGFVSRRAGAWDSAVTHLEAASEMDPFNNLAFYELGGTLMVLRRYGDARRALQRAIDIAPDDPGAYARMVWLALAAGGDLAGARAVLLSAEQRMGPERLLAHFAVRGFVHAPFSRVLLVDSVYREMLGRLTLRAAGVDSASYHVFKADLLAFRGDSAGERAHLDSALAVLARRLRAAVPDYSMYAILGLVEAGLGRREDAVRDGRRAVAMVSHPVDDLSLGMTRANLGVILARVGRPDSAIVELTASLARPNWFSARVFALDPAFASLRGDPRFRRLVAGP